MKERVTTKNKIGLAIAAVLGLLDCIALAFPTPEGELGPPIGVLILSAICGVITLAAVVPAWRQGNRVAVRVAAGARIVSALTALPAFFVEVPPAVVILVSAFIALTVLSVVLMLTPARHQAPVLD